MTQWALEHPFLTFILAMFLLMVLDDVVGNFARIRIAKHSRREGVE